MPTKGLLLLSAGSKIAIARIAKESAFLRGLALHVSDCRHDVPTRLVSDQFVEFPPNDSPNWGNLLLDYCATNAIGLIVPTRHSDLLPLSRISGELARIGTALPLSSPACLDICLRKSNTARFFESIGIPTPQTTLRRDLDTSPLANRFPLFAKPNTGSAASGTRIVETADQVSGIPDDWILQTIATGNEYTINVYIDRHGAPLCIIPHRRIEIEAGEVTQARTERVSPLIEAARHTVSALPGATGILNLQAFHNPTSGAFQFIEINPRIGGGFPLVHQAKGHYIEWLCQEWLDGKSLRSFDRWTKHLLMMRHREALFEIRSSDT